VAPLTEGALNPPGRPARFARRSRLSWLRTVHLLARPITRTMPWVTLIVGCLAGTVFLAILAPVADGAHWSLGEADVRLALLPAIAALAFVVRDPFRPLTQATPVPARVGPAARILVAAPVLAMTCWAQLRIMSHTISGRALHDQLAVYPLIAQFTGWCLVTVAAAAWVDRSRYADLGGALAGPVSLAVIGIVWYAPVSARLLVGPPATAHGVTVAWYAVACAGLVLSCLAMRDRWHRYGRTLHQLSPRQRNRLATSPPL
jgi:hypothetical protein